MFVDAKEAQILHAVCQNRESLAYLFGVPVEHLSQIVYYELGLIMDPCIEDTELGVPEVVDSRVESWGGFYTELMHYRVLGSPNRAIFCRLMNGNQYVSDAVVWASIVEYEDERPTLTLTLKELLPVTAEAVEAEEKIDAALSKPRNDVGPRVSSRGEDGRDEPESDMGSSSERSS